MKNSELIIDNEYQVGSKDNIASFQFIENGISYFLPVKGCESYFKDDKYKNLIGFYGTSFISIIPNS